MIFYFLPSKATIMRLESLHSGIVSASPLYGADKFSIEGDSKNVFNI